MRSRRFLGFLSALAVLLPLTTTLLAAPAQATPGAVGGAVYDSLGDPLAQVTVTALAAPAYVTVVSQTTTAGDGTYGLALTEGSYHLQFSRPGLAPAMYGGDDVLRVDMDDEGQVSVAGEPVEDNALDDVSMTALPATEFPVAGRVVDANGEPVAGASVTVDPVGAATDSGQGATTDTGDYSVSVQPGTYRVSITRTGWVSTRYGGATTPSTVTVGQVGTVFVAGADALIDNRLGDVVLQSTPFAVIGSVADEAGAGLTGITVRALLSDGGDAVDTATSGPAGDYSLWIPVGRYDLEYLDDDGTAPTFGSAARSLVVSQGGALSVDGTSVPGLPEVRLPRAASEVAHPVVGSVADALGAPVDGLIVTAVPQAGGALATATTGADGVLGDHGRYRLMLLPGAYELRVAGGADWYDAAYEAGGEQTALVQVALNGTISVNGTPIPGRDLGDTTVRTRPTYLLTGTVVEDGVPLPGITVTAYSQADWSTPVATTVTGGDGRWSFEDADGLTAGTFSLEFSGSSGDVAYGRQWVGGSDTGPLVVRQDGVVTLDGAVVPDAVLPPLSLTRYELHPVVGSLVDVLGEPVDGLTVRATPLVPGGLPASATTGVGTDHGRYRIMLWPGRYRLDFDGGTDWHDATFTGGGTGSALVDVKLDGTARINRVDVVGGELGSTTVLGRTTYPLKGSTTEDGAPLANVTRAIAYPADFTGDPNDWTAYALTGADGTWTLSGDQGLAVGAYQIRLDSWIGEVLYEATWFGGATPRRVVVHQGGAVTVDDEPVQDSTLPAVEMTRNEFFREHAVLGLVQDGAGTPLDGVTVSAQPNESNAFSRASTTVTGADGILGDHGRYRLRLRPGSYHLTFSREGLESQARDVHVLLDGSIVALPLWSPVTDGLQPVTLTGTPVVDPPPAPSAPTVVTAPVRTGRVAVGRIVSTTLGAWSIGLAGETVRVDWFVDGAPADRWSSGTSGRRFTVPASAVGKVLTYRVTVVGVDGRPDAVWTSGDQVVAKAVSRVRAAYSRSRLRIAVTVPGIARPTGVLTVRDGRKVLRVVRLRPLAEGVAVLRLGLRPGRHHLGVAFAGSPAVSASRTRLTVQVTRSPAFPGSPWQVLSRVG